METPGYQPGNTPEMAARQPDAAAPQEVNATALSEEQRLIENLRQGDEQAFMLLVERYHPLLLRLALMYLPNRTLAEEAVQETWIGVLQGIARFEGRSSLKTWISHILINRAKTYA